ncbi:MAG TPA: hypothetical protein VGD08_02755 [Stellaceae bacterium]|jgi:hypothetical protein
MAATIKIELEVTPDAAAALADEGRRRRAGELLSRLVRPGSPSDDPLMALFDEIQRDAEARGLTDKDIEAELAAYNAERRDRR